ncbi:phage major capsid protein [Alkalicoccobacillus gibsonii]|uniref:phage major capsid protein n=1 Tax=Alkalicoccobacillus gibsonii TaxID=79881 RepID=UPI003F7C570F
MKRIEEILQRKKEINDLLKDEKRSKGLNLTDLEKEVRELNEELEELQTRERLMSDTQEIQSGTAQTRSIETFNADETRSSAQGETDIRSMHWNDAINTDEYRSAWAKDMMDKNLSNEEREILEKVNAEYREFTHDTTNTQILIPKTVTAGIWTRAEEESSLWADVRKMFVTGNLTMIKGDPSDDAKWYDESDTVDTDELGFGELNLTGCELAKAVAVTWKLKKMSVQQFEAYIIAEIGKRMGTALAYGVYVGRGKPTNGENFKAEPYGIKTRLVGNTANRNQLKTYSSEGLAFKDLTGMMGAIFSAYASGATIYANNTTIWGVLANLVDGVGRPLFIADVQAGGVGRIFGRTVKADAAIPDGELLLGNLSEGYLANINEGVTMHRQTHMRKRIDEYMGYAIVDGDVFDPKAFVILQASNDEEGSDAPTV